MSNAPAQTLDDQPFQGDPGVPANRNNPVSEPLAWPDAPVSMIPLDLSSAPTEARLRAAGGLGGPLCPIDNADPEKVPELMAARGADRDTIVAKQARLKEINMSFGRALVTLKRHDFAGTISLYEEHLKKYPDSPWAGEIMLHLGKFAAASGRYSEAEDRYAAILQVTSDDPQNSTFDMAQKTKMAWASLDMMLGRWNGAAEKLDNIFQTDRHWRRLTWARYFRQEVELSSQSRDLQACGAHALAVILVAMGQKQAGARVGKLQAPREAGFSLAELEQIARKNGVPMRGFKARVEDLANMPMPLLVHYDFNGGHSGQGGFQKIALAPHCPACLIEEHELSQPIAISRAKRVLRGPFRPGVSETSSGHFLILRAADVKQRKVTIFNPLEKRTYDLSYAQFAREWSGTGLALERPIIAKGKTKPGVRLARNSSVRLLTMVEMSHVRGGCCCADKPQTKDGGGDGNIEVAGPTCPITSYGSPTIDVNPGNLNVHLKDTPVWYDSPLGFEVPLTMHYNRMDAGLRFNVFGQKWSCLFDASLLFTGTNIIDAYMPDGKQDRYVLNGAVYKPELLGHFEQIRHNVDGSYSLFFPEGGYWVFQIPAGLSEYRLVKTVDIFGNWMAVNYETTAGGTVRINNVGEGASDQATAARLIDFDYGDSAHPSQPTTITMPFGRVANFSYDSSGRLSQVLDQNNQPTRYTYATATSDISSLTVAPDVASFATGDYRRWTFATVASQTQGYPIMRADMPALVITDPLGKKEDFYYDASHANADGQNKGRTYHTPKRYRTAGFSTVGQTSYEFAITASTQWEISAIYPPSTDSLTSGDGAMHLGYDSLGLPNSMTVSYTGGTRTINVARNLSNGDTNSVTRDGFGGAAASTYSFHYGSFVNTNFAAPSTDMTSMEDANNQTVSKIVYNDRHQPTTEYYGPTGTGAIPTTYLARIAYTYTPWGAPASQILSGTGVNRSIYWNYDYNSSTGTGTRRLVSMTANDTAANGGLVLSYFNYEPGGSTRVSKIIDEAGKSTYYSYDGLDRVTSVKFDDQTRQDYTYCSSCGTQTSASDRDGRVTTYTPDDLGRITQSTDPSGLITKFYYDVEGNLIKLIDPSNKITQWQYDERGQVKNKTYDSGEIESYLWDGAGEITAIQNKLGADSVNAKIYDRDPGTGMIAQVRYYTKIHENLNYYSSGTADNRHPGQSYWPTRSAGGGPSSAGPNTAISYVYDPNGRLYSATDSSSGTSSFTYDVLGRQTRENGPFANDTVASTYNAADERTLVQVLNDSGTVRDSYSTQTLFDSLGRVQQINGISGSFTYAYDPSKIGLASLPTSMTWPSQGGVSVGTATFGYDNLNRLITTNYLRNSDGALYSAFTSKFDDDVTVGGIQRARDVKVRGTKRLRDPANVLGSLRNFTYGYESDTNPVGLDRLTSEASAETNPSLKRKFTYDDSDNLGTISNLSTASTVPSRTTQTRNALNQVIQTVTVPTDANGTPVAGTTVTKTFRCDSRGNLIGSLDGAGSMNDSLNTPTRSYDGTLLDPDPTRYFDTLYEYNSLDQLIAVEKRAHDSANTIQGEFNNLRTEFSYDGLGRRRSARELVFDLVNPANPAMGYSWQDRGDTYFVYDGMQIIQERDSANITQVQLGWGLGMEGGAGGLLHRSVKNGASWRHYLITSDHSGNVTQLIREDTGAVVARYDYDSYGWISLAQGTTTSDAIDQAQVSDNSYLTQSKWRHNQSGLVDFGHRFYSLELGRWMNRDPLGELGGINLYSYAGADPVDLFDPDGLQVTMDFPFPQPFELPQIGALPRVGSMARISPWPGEVLPPTIMPASKGGGKNAKHSSEARRAAAREKYQQAKSDYEKAHSKPNKTPADKEAEAQAQRAMNRAKQQMDNTGENHSQRAKGSNAISPPSNRTWTQRWKDWWDSPAALSPQC